VQVLHIFYLFLYLFSRINSKEILPHPSIDILWIGINMIVTWKKIRRTKPNHAPGSFVEIFSSHLFFYLPFLFIFLLSVKQVDECEVFFLILLLLIDIPGVVVRQTEGLSSTKYTKIIDIAKCEYQLIKV
jgi:hypothetical protein